MAHRIVLVEDNERTRAAMRRLLERHGLRVREATRDSDVAQDDQADVVIVRDASGSRADGSSRPWPAQRERVAYERMEARLRTEHEGEFVALFRGRALGFGATPREAIGAGIAALGRPAVLFVHRIGDPIPEPEAAPESFRMDSPREAVEST